jgi:hypothetical protein
MYRRYAPSPTPKTLRHHNAMKNFSRWNAEHAE